VSRLSWAWCAMLRSIAVLVLLMGFNVMCGWACEAAAALLHCEGCSTSLHKDLIAGLGCQLHADRPSCQRCSSCSSTVVALLCLLD
jgi:hypothetical protein